MTPAGTHALTPTEVRLLQVLIASLDRTVPTETLLDRVWSDADGADPSYVWVTVRRLRRKLELDPDNPRYLLTERGVGYRLVSASAAAPTGAADGLSAPRIGTGHRCALCGPAGGGSLAAAGRVRGLSVFAGLARRLGLDRHGPRS